MDDKINEINEESQLLRDIELYFDCRLTDEEEQELCRQLAHTKLNHPAVDEARAVMGFATILNHYPQTAQESGQVRRSYGSWKRLAGAAAAVVLILTVGATVLRSAGSYRSESIAYVNGQRITDEKDVWEIAAQDAAALEKAFDECIEGTADDIEALCPMMENVEKNYDLSDLI